MLTGQAGIIQALQYFAPNDEEPTAEVEAMWTILTKASLAIGHGQRYLMQMRLASLKQASTSSSLQFVFAGNDTTVQLFGERLFDLTEDQLQKLAKDKAKLYGGR